MKEEFEKVNLTPEERDELLRKIESNQRVAESNEEGGFFEHTGMNYEEVAKSLERLGDSGGAKEALKRAMENYERAMWFDDAFRLAKRMGDQRAAIYETLSKVRVFRDGDGEIQGLFRELKKKREFYGHKEASRDTPQSI